ncbi:G-type lectin S-receptor-like serine/threonine-protein kinase At2g19130 [Typha latifolia]|uniref:G-type lectin S-receptor-like serine/threonine-protein kinase At2g19130 n=1 Tax=Typha latifolia TaxID=4733 RepID=UPI003C2E185F
MDTRSSTPLIHYHYLVLLFFAFSSILHHSVAVDRLSHGQSLSGEQTIISQGGKFELGFFSPGKSNKYYVGIWYKKVSKQTIVWVANRERPVSNHSSSELKLSEDGSNLVILTHPGTQIWSSNSTTTSSNSTIAVLLDDGNLVLKHNSLSSSNVFWQSFDYPTNTWLPGANLGYDKLAGKNRFLTSWKNSEDPSPGLFSVEIDPGGISQFYLLANRTHQYWTTGVWDGEIFSNVPEMRSNYFFNFNYVANINVNYFSYAIRDPSDISNFMVDFTGQMKRRRWDTNAKDWILYCSLPRDPCDVYGICGSFGSCSNTSSPSCRCLQGFEPPSVDKWNLGDTSSGCVRHTSLECGRKDGFTKLSNVQQLPPNPEHATVSSKEECELTCLNNCSCAAYSYDTSRCLIWKGDLLNLKVLSGEPENQGEIADLYLRLAASELTKPKGTKKKEELAVIASVASLALIITIGSAVLMWKFYKRRDAGKLDIVHGALLSFDYKLIKRVTKDFSDKLGSGGFGTVFKGILPDSTPIAVKKLEGSRQGEKQFRAEVATLGLIQHVNLVRLRGFCAEGDRRLLVYDYMPRGSLDSYLFRSSSQILDWSQRYKIAVGIARGLAYLHEKCRECIIHCDIKPENILLDEELCPKVADFGMAKLIGHEFSRALTTLRGTLGYLAPEWIAGTAITPKSDVYSFGMLLLEIISGKRNREVSEDRLCPYFPALAATKLHEGEVICLLDERLEGKANMEEIGRACRIACWCIQDQEVSRPTMGYVVQQLEKVVDVSMPPIPSLLQKFADNDSVMIYECSKTISASTGNFTREA